MASRINTDEIDESLVVAAVRKERTIREIVPQPVMSPLPATVTAQTDEPPVEKPKVKEELPKDDIPAATPEPAKDENRGKRGGQQEYETFFLKESDLPPVRFGKSVYIRKEYHDRISQIVSVIGGNEVSLFGYVDNVLAHHFENYRDDIARSFKKKIIFK